ncbi:DUF2141 domain-containing protein [Motiliproteus sp. MSK22-1]|uniref:DUF2141 domain-containing protein n=1 Tax=Motiliproteus sp. MSK22-1 TaxID=1897630 RepID=UPI00097638FB|nr:DUF2141 domain-containing protein [Motiliproteus sp. MSK22-1]OMH25818.1 hypothetical protein BGP75_25190 [Motiliproteus sp. MSK22-1]
MKTLLIILWSLLMLIANSAIATELKVKVRNIDVGRGGQVIVMVFGEAGFPKDHDQAVFYEARDSLQPVMEFVFEVNMEVLAIKVLHDENKDGTVTKNWTGIYPKEGLGFSNKQKIGLTGPPKYKYSKLSKEQFMGGLDISLLYP